MDFTGKVCPYCKTEFKEGDDIVVCSICEMPHHKDCWIENKACTTFGCTGTIVGAEQYADAVENGSFCSKCGAPMKEGQKFCATCGTPAGATGEPHFRVAGAYAPAQNGQQSTYMPSQTQYAPPQVQYTPPQTQYAPSQQPYAPQYSVPQSPGAQYGQGYGAYGQQQQNVDPDFYSFIRSNQTYYASSFQKMQATNSSASWNWCSFLFSAYWLAYRKMYGIAAAYAVVSFVLGLIPGIGAVLGFAMSICAGIFGNHFYKQYVDGELQIARNMDMVNKNAYIAKKGGTSLGAVWAFIGIMFLLGLIAGSSI